MSLPIGIVVFFYPYPPPGTVHPDLPLFAILRVCWTYFVSSLSPIHEPLMSLSSLFTAHPLHSFTVFLPTCVLCTCTLLFSLHLHSFSVSEIHPPLLYLCDVSGLASAFFLHCYFFLVTTQVGYYLGMVYLQCSWIGFTVHVRESPDRGIEERIYLTLHLRFS